MNEENGIALKKLTYSKISTEHCWFVVCFSRKYYHSMEWNNWIDCKDFNPIWLQRWFGEQQTKN